MPSGPGLGFVTLPLMETEAPSLQGASAQWVHSVDRAFPCVPTPGTRQQGGVLIALTSFTAFTF